MLFIIALPAGGLNEYRFPGAWVFTELGETGSYALSNFKQHLFKL